MKVKSQQHGDWDLALTALTILEAADFQAGSWSSVPGQFPHFDFSPSASRVLEILHESGLVQPFDWSAWQTSGERLVMDPRALARAGRPTLAKLLTLHVRKDRFCEGHLASMLQSGHVAAILRRAGELRSASPDPGICEPLSSRLATILTHEQVDQALPAVAPGLQKYVWLQQHLHERNVSNDREYRRRFGGFYRVRRGGAWRDAYFDLLEAEKVGSPSIRDVLNRLHVATGHIEASFASKLVATIDPSQPILDSVVLGNLGLTLPIGRADVRIDGVVELHARLAQGLSEFLTMDSGGWLMSRFKASYPDANITPIKMVDLVLWKS